MPNFNTECNSIITESKLVSKTYFLVAKWQESWFPSLKENSCHSWLFQYWHNTCALSCIVAFFFTHWTVGNSLHLVVSTSIFEFSRARQLYVNCPICRNREHKNVMSSSALVLQDYMCSCLNRALDHWTVVQHLCLLWMLMQGLTLLLLLVIAKHLVSQKLERVTLNFESNQERSFQFTSCNKCAFFGVPTWILSIGLF